MTVSIHALSSSVRGSCLCFRSHLYAHLLAPFASPVPLQRAPVHSENAGRDGEVPVCRIEHADDMRLDNGAKLDLLGGCGSEVGSDQLDVASDGNAWH